MTMMIKVKRSTGRYNPDNYNLHVYKTKPGKAWHVEDVARNVEQAKSMVTSQPPGCMIIVSTPEYKEFPYHLYARESLLQKRYEQIRQGVRFK